ncbi:MAG: hypothetical protein ACYDGY_11155 [Acidimicrobiales bacterium]
MPFPFHFVGPGTLLDGEEPMVELFVNDITDGIADTSVRAALSPVPMESTSTRRFRPTSCGCYGAVWSLSQIARL